VTPVSSALAGALRVQPRRSQAASGAVVELRPDAGVILKQEPGTLVWRETLADGSEAAFKLYRRGLLAWLRCRLGSFRTWNEFRALQQLEALGVRCTSPLFWSQGHFDRHGWGELLATEWLASCRPLDEVLAEESGAGTRINLEPLWTIVGRLHDAGFMHGTLLARNILVRGESAAPEVFLLDLPRFHRFPYPIRGTRMARYDLLLLIHTLLRSRPATEVPQWLTVYGMTAEQQAEFIAQMRRFRNSPRLRRMAGAEFNVRAMLAAGRHRLRLLGRHGTPKRN